MLSSTLRSKQGSRQETQEEKETPHQAILQIPMWGKDSALNLEDLPPEMMAHICSYLPFKALCHLSTISKKLRDFMMTYRLQEFVSISGEKPNAYILGDILLGPTMYLDMANGGVKAGLLDIKDIQTLKQQLTTYKSKLTGLCLAGFMGQDRHIAEITALLPNLTVLDISYSRFALINEISGQLPEKCGIKAINIGTTPYMRYGDGTDVLLHEVVKGFINKCPQLTHFVLHGLDLSRDTIRYMGNNLPNTVISLDLARNYIKDEEITPIIERCPDMQFLDLSGTSVSTKTFSRIANRWGKSIVSLALPQKVARELTLYKDAPKDKAILKLLGWVKSLTALKYFRIGDWRLGMATETHWSYRGNMSLGYLMEQKVIRILNIVLPSTITIHMSPYAEEDKLYYQQHGVPKPNPDFPPTSDPLYTFQTLGKTDSKRRTCQLSTKSNYLFDTRSGPQEYYLSPEWLLPLESTDEYA